jgi:hypothetical protein
MFWSSLLESLDDCTYVTLGQTIRYSPGARFRLGGPCADASRSSESFTSDLSSQQLSGAPQIVAEVRSVGVVSEKADQVRVWFRSWNQPLLILHNSPNESS